MIQMQSMLDVADCDDEKVKKALESIEGVIRVRIV